MLFIAKPFIIFQSLSIYAISYKLGIGKVQIEKIVDEWQNNDGYIIVESKINS